MNVERLSRLADFLDTVREDRFNIFTWGRDWISCGFVGCAGGWACQIPEFAETGLKLVPFGFNNTIMFGEYDSFEAISVFFGLGYDQTRRVFSYMGYDKPIESVTPADVANRIREELGAFGPATKEHL